MIQLNNCPCGKPPTIEYGTHWTGQRSVLVRATVQCIAPFENGMMHHLKCAAKTEEEAIQLWNTLFPNKEEKNANASTA
jgi:hypothetical protein